MEQNGLRHQLTFANRRYSNCSKQSIHPPIIIILCQDGVQFPTFDCVTLSQQQIKLPGEFIHKTTLVLLSMRGVGLVRHDYNKSHLFGGGGEVADKTIAIGYV